MVSININFSNKAVYLFVGAFAFLIITSLVIALGSVPNPGHAISELQTCGANQTLKTNAAGNGWECVDATGGSFTCTDVITTVGSTGNQLCSNLGGYTCFSVTAADMSSGTLGSSSATCGWVSTTTNYRARCCKLS